ncbi:MAG: serine hydrolase [Rhodospirillaceae bacterium]|nr:serine hydrolase [Rhodospirillaceae bacterium]
MTSVLERLIADRPGEPGIAAAILRSGEVVERRCVGLADLAHRVAIGPETRFHIVSASKTFVAASVLALAARGQISVDDPARRHLPELPETIDRPRPVTLRHLLSMTSGLRDVLEIARLRGEWKPSPSRVRDLLDLAFAQTETSAPAGAQYMYANVNFVLLEEILRRLAGDADALRRDAIYRPLGLAGTADRPHEGIVLANLAQPYVADGKDGWTRATDLLGISGDTLTTSLDDMARWVAAFGRGQVGDLDLRPMAEPARLADGRAIHYGLGLCIRPYRGLTVLGHTGSQPGYKTHIAYVPALNVGVVVLSNREDTRASALAVEILDAVAGGFPSPHPAKTSRKAPHRAESLPGVYVEPETGEWMQVTLGADGVLTCETLGDSLWLYEEAPGIFRHGDDYRCDTPADAVFSHDGCRLHRGGHVNAMVKQKPVIYTPAQLAAFAGDYASAAIASHHEVRLAGGGLSIRYGLGFDRDRVFAMQPVAPDIFLVRPTAPGVAHRHVFRFERDGAGAVTGMQVTLDRLKGVRLERVAA